MFLFAGEGDTVHEGDHAPLSSIGAYCAAHALVDASCAALVFSAAASGRLPAEQALFAVVVYNLLAFASQPLLGWFVNDVSAARVWARVGGLAVVVAFVASLSGLLIWPAIVLTGIGNAVFHLGGGVIALRAQPGRATIPGLYVAPGAAGLAAGLWMGAHQLLPWLPALTLLLVIPILRGAAGTSDAHASTSRRISTAVPFAVIGVLFAVVAARAFIGSAVPLPWKVDPGLLVALTAAVVAGKAAGGVLADRFGRVFVGVGALVVSAPLLMVALGSAAAGIAGMLLFNMTMPVTLVAIADLVPERPGFAFGLTCLALIAGGLPALVHLTGTITPVPVVICVMGSAALLWAGLRWTAREGTVEAGLRPRFEEV
jgi:FSR family fosmidomycin resistance protein-like MFS transporter